MLKHRTTAADTQRRRLAVLVADDTRANQRLVRSVLAARGHEVTIVTSGRDAVDCVLQGHFDVVLMDVKMPAMDGHEATKLIRQHEQSQNRHTPIIAMTTHSATGDREQCLAAGMDCYFMKPIDATLLIEMVERVAEGMRPAGRKKHTEDTPPSVINVEQTMQRLHGDMELFREFIRLFDEDSPQMLRSLREAVSRRDKSVVERSAHSLKGLISNFGASFAVKAAANVEDMDKADWSAVGEAVQILETEIARLKEALNEYRC